MKLKMAEGIYIFELYMSVKLEVNFESLFERLEDCTVIDDLKAITSNFSEG